MKTKATLIYEVTEIDKVYTIRFDINKESLMAYMTVYDDIGNLESQTEYFLSDDEEWKDLEHEIGQLELDMIFGSVERLK